MVRFKNSYQLFESFCWGQGLSRWWWKRTDQIRNDA